MGRFIGRDQRAFPVIHNIEFMLVIRGQSTLRLHRRDCGEPIVHDNRMASGVSQVLITSKITKLVCSVDGADMEIVTRTWPGRTKT